MFSTQLVCRVPRTSSLLFTGLLLSLLSVALTTYVLSAESGYHIIDSLRLGGEGGWDYLAVDTAAQRIYISRGTRVQVVDLATHAIVGEIPNTIGVHGIALVPSQGRGYASNGRILP
jgi:hypothetical protein